MRFKIGDKVRVRKDLEVDKKYGNLCFIGSMKKYKGKEFIIDKVCTNYYRLKDIDHCWTDEMLEPVEKGEKSMNIEELNLEYKNKMDALMEEYKTKAKELAEEEPFIREGQGYFTINKLFGIDEFNYDSDIFDRELLESGNMFPFTDENREQVEKEVSLIAERRKLQLEMEMFARQNNEEEIDWNNSEQVKWYLYLIYEENEIREGWTCATRHFNTTYFTSRKVMLKALDKFGDRIRELYLKQEEQ